jgi:hypothetical protein
MKSKKNASQAGDHGQPVGAPPAAAPRMGGPRPPADPGGTMAVGDEDRFLETTYRNGEFTQRVLTRKEALALDDGDPDVDVYINEASGRISIRTRGGELLRYTGRIPGVGSKVGRPFLDELMWQPGELLSVERLLQNPNLKSFKRPDTRATRLKALRTAFGETDEDPWYFTLCRGPWRIRWNQERSWRIVERLAQPAAQRCAQLTN